MELFCMMEAKEAEGVRGRRSQHLALDLEFLNSYGPLDT